MTRSFLLAFATLALAADLPRPAGYVSDLAGRLTPAVHDSLEARLRDYERATGNEVAIAIVPSLEGESIEDYARELFHAWGIGKRDRNNGVLFLWAPVERKVRIQVGYGLEGTLSDRAASDILRDVTARFRNDDYTGGINAAVDGIIDRIGGEGGAAQGARGVSVFTLIAGSVMVVLLVTLLVRRVRTRRFAEALPGDLERAAADLGSSGELQRAAVQAIEELRREAPPDAWQEFATLPESAREEFVRLQQELYTIRLIPHEDASAIRGAHHALNRWRAHYSAACDRVNAPAKRLDDYRRCRQEAPLMMRDIAATLAGRATANPRRRAGKLAAAASAAYTRASAAAEANPANWLLVYDLLLDARDCLQCADGRGSYRRGARYWGASGAESPAYDLLMTEAASSSSGSSGSDGGASFGGGDCGGGGASSSY